MSTAFRLAPWKQIARPNDDVLGGALDMGTYAVNLASVFRARPGTPDVYRDPERFFRATYFTERMRELMADVSSALGGGAGDRVLQLRTPFGGGKTHSLVALLHAARNPAIATSAPELAGVWKAGEVRVAVLSGEELDPLRPTNASGVETHTLWGELGAQLGRFEVVAEHDRLHSAPGGDTLREVLGEGPVLVLLDEVLIYVEKGKAVPQGDSTRGRQAMLFMEALTEVVKDSQNAVVVYSLQASAGEAAGAEGLLVDLDHLVSRVDAKREPVSGDEVMRVVQRRLFASLGDDSVQREVARGYADLVRRQLSVQAETEDARREAADEGDRLEQRILVSYPFHPALLDLMYHRWGTLPSYQRTRGALQFLACVTHDLWERGEDSPLIGPGEVNLGDPQTRGAFFTQIGERERYQAVVEGDVVAEGSGAATVDRRIGTDSPALAQLRVGTRMATAIMLYSFGSREGEGERGVLETDLLAAALAPGLDRNLIVAALHDLREEELFLHYSGRRYRFEPTYNISKLIRDEANKLTADEVLAPIRDELEAQLRGERGAVLWPRGPEQVRDRVPQFQFVYLSPDWNASSQPLHRWLEETGSGKRAYQNGLTFVQPDGSQFDRVRAAARVRVACQRLLDRRAQMGFSEEQSEEVRERLAAARRDVQSGVTQAYARASLPLKAPPSSSSAYVWEESDLRPLLTAGAGLQDRVREALSHRVFDRLTLDKLISLAGLGENRGFVMCSDLVDSFYSYFDFTKLLSSAALQAAIAAGVEDGKLGYVVGAEIDAGELRVRNPSLIRLGGGVVPAGDIDLGPGAALLTPELARSLMPAPQPVTGPGEGEPEPAPPPIAPPPPPVHTSLGLRFRIAGSRLFDLQRVLSWIRDNSSTMDVEVTVRSVSSGPTYDDVAMRNNVTEPLTEAGVDNLRLEQS